MKPKHFLITGGAGFIGSHLADALLEQGHTVTVLDDLSTGKLENIAHRMSHPRFQFVHGSILDVQLVDRLTAKAEQIYHLAAVVGVKYVVDDPLRGMLVNVKGTEVVLEAALRHERKILIASSSEVYGKSMQVPFRENDNSVFGPTSIPRWAYALAKTLDEHFAFAYHRQRGLKTVAVRYFNAYGPRLDPRGYGSVVARFITQALTGQDLTVYGDGQQTRSFTFIEDTVRGTMAAMSTPAGEGLAFNIGNPREISIEALAHRIRAIVGADVDVAHVPYAQAYGPDFEETRRRLPDGSRAAEILGFRAEIPLDVGLQKTIVWFEEHQDELIST